MSKYNPISAERKKERKDAVIKELKALIFPLVLLAIFAGLVYFVMTFQAKENEEELIQVYSYTGDEQPLVLENEYLKFVMDPTTTTFDVTVKSSGKVWHSVPEGGADDPAAIMEEKNKLQSTLLIKYSTEAGLDTTLDSHSMSAVSGIYDIEKGDDYIKVLYTMGNISKEYVYPPAMQVDRFEEYCKKLDISKSETVKQFYKKLDINNLKGKDKDKKDEYLENYPILANEPLYIIRNPDDMRDSNKKNLQKMFEEAGYTYEEFVEDKELSNKEVANDKPVFNASLIYKLDGDDLRVEVPFADFESKTEYPIYEITVLPYFGSGSKDDKGYMVVPEGGGSILDFNNGKSAQSIYVTRVYGWDYAIERAAVVHDPCAQMNCFGISDYKNSFVCTLEEGSAYAAVNADISGRTTSYNYVNASYIIQNKEKYDLGANSNQDMYVFLENIPRDESIIQKYSFIDSGSYVDMAKDYQQYLLNHFDGYMTKKTETSTPVEVEIVGAVDKVKQIMGLPIQRPLPLTTYKEAGEILDKLKSDGIDNLHVKYTGWCNGGVQQKYAVKAKTITSLGSKKDLMALSNKAKELGYELYLDGITEYGMNSTIFNGFFSYRDAAKFLSRKRAELYRYSQVTYAQRDGFKDYFLLHGDTIIDISKSFANKVAGYNAGISFQDIGTDLASDYYRKDYTSRDEAKVMQSQMVKEIKDGGQNVMINTGNAYVAGYADMITNMDLRGSEYTILDKCIPFYQIAIHGYLDYTGTPVNISGNDLEAVLYAAEYGAGLSFTFMKESPFALQKTLYSEYYASDFDALHDKMFDIYDRYNKELGHTFNQEIVNHENLSADVKVTEYEDGTKVYVNYGYYDFDANGTNVPARDYLVVR